MSKFSLLSINLHCLEEVDIKLNQRILCKKIGELNIDIIMMQEVAQYFDDTLVVDEIKSSNYGYQIQQMLLEFGLKYYYYFAPIKKSFDKYDEGLGILSKFPLTSFESYYISKNKNYNDWKSRKMIRGDLIYKGKRITLCNVHMGWTDENEVFEDQIDELLLNSNSHNLTIFAGDFNVRPMSNEYNYVVSKGLIDVFQQNKEMFFESTFPVKMDIHNEISRIDYFFTNEKVILEDSIILFKKLQISDHFGVYIKIKI